MHEALLVQPLLRKQVEMGNKVQRYAERQKETQRQGSGPTCYDKAFRHATRAQRAYNIFQQTHGTMSQSSSSACGIHPATPPDLGVSSSEKTRDSLPAYECIHMPRKSCSGRLKIKGPVEADNQYLTRRRERTFVVMSLWMARTRGMCCGEDLEGCAK